MVKKFAAITAVLLSSYANAEVDNTWYAGTTYVGTVVTQGLTWACSGGTCTLSGPYGDGLNMAICQELSHKVGGLSYYYNETGMTWSDKKNSALLKQCNKK